MPGLFKTPEEIFSGKLPVDFGISKTEGSSLTIPGQGSDLATIIASVVRLPPIDERDYDSPSGVDPDVRAMAAKTALDGMYLAEAVTLGEEALERQKARKKAKEEKESAAEEGTPEKKDE